MIAIHLISQSDFPIPPYQGFLFLIIIELLDHHILVPMREVSPIPARNLKFQIIVQPLPPMIPAVAIRMAYVMRRPILKLSVGFCSILPSPAILLLALVRPLHLLV